MNVNRINPSSSQHAKVYLELPARLAKNDARRQPSLQSAIAFDLSSAHPFYEHSEAAFFTVGDSRRPDGRIAVLNNRNFNKHHGTRWAFFTHFECEDDPTAAQCLFDTAADWANEHKLNLLVGPVGLLQTDARGMMVTGHEKLSSFAMPYSPPYYSTLMEYCGFTKHYDYLVGEVSNTFQISERVLNVADRIEKRSNVRICSTTNRRTLKRLAPQLFQLYKNGGTEAGLYYPITQAEEKCILNQLSKTICPPLVHWVEDRGTICGMYIASPNYSEALRKAGPGALKRKAAVIRQRRRPHEIDFVMNYIDPAHHGRGLNFLLYLAIQKAALRLDCNRGLCGPIHEHNLQGLTVVQKIGVTFDIIHRVFKRGLE